VFVVSPGGNAPRKPLSASIRAVWPLLKELIRPRLGRLILVLLLVVIGRAASLALPASTKYLVDDVIVGGQLGLLWPIVLGIVGAGIVHAMTQLASIQLLAIDGLALVQQLRCRLQDHVARLPLAFFDSRQSGALGRRIMEDPAGARNLFGIPLVEFVGSILVGIYSLAFLLQISARLTIAALVSMALFSLLSKRGFTQIHPLFGGNLKAAAEVTGRLVESLAGIRVVKGYRAEEHERRRFAAAAERLYGASVQLSRVMANVNAINTAVMGVGTAGIMYLATYEILAGRLTLGGLATFMAFLAFLMTPIAQIAPLGTLIAEALASLGQVDELLRTVPEDASPRRQRVLEAIEGHVVFDDVSFSYENNVNVLKDISFEARPGTVTALVGPSGAGKSTIISLVAAYYEATAGAVRVDGADVSTLRLDSYRRQLGVVLQDNFLFDGTIRDNVAFARPEASDREIVDACRTAHVHEFAERLPDGYTTVVGERGVKLSMGQRQRISIARAILANPRILILDEATSSLDSESEAAIQAGLEYLLKGRTTFVVAHRLSTIHRADQILLIEDGRVVERGSHESLYASRGRYYELSTRQFHGSQVETPAVV
jgi:ABC-type multidrug transport system fused ATPase/permease subunit